MSTQHSDKDIAEAFTAILSLYEGFFEHDSPLNISPTSKFFEYYNSQGSMDWHPLYEIDELEITKELMEEFGSEIGLKMPKDETDFDSMLQNKERVEDIMKSGIIPNEEKLEKKFHQKGIRYLLLTRALKVMLCCRIQYEVPIGELINQAKKGNRKAFLKLVRLDSTFLSRSFAKRILKEVELANDRNFKIDLTTMLIAPRKFWTLKGGKKNKRDYLALWLLYYIGYADRTDSEWADFLYSQGFTNFKTYVNVNQAKTRYKIGQD